MAENFEFSWENPEYRKKYHHTSSHIERASCHNAM